MRVALKKRAIGARVVRYALHAVMTLAVVSVVCHGFAAAASRLDREWTDNRGYPIASAQLQVSAKRGNARAQTVLGFAYATGRGVPQNFAAAVKWYRRAAAKGNSTAQYLLGLMYDHGQGVRQNKIIAHKWLILAAAGASGKERDDYARIRDAVASTMSATEIAEAQYLAYQWTRMHKR
jgi:TPR repeat protein